MLRVALASLLTLFALAPAFSMCAPPPGLPLQQWYSLCSGDLQLAYQQGGQQLGIPFQTFVQNIYGGYLRNSAAMLGGGGMTMAPPAATAPGSFMCSIGSRQCFSGYVRTCQAMPTGGSWWITGADLLIREGGQTAASRVSTSFTQ